MCHLGAGGGRPRRDGGRAGGRARLFHERSYFCTKCSEVFKQLWVPLLADTSCSEQAGRGPELAEAGGGRHFQAGWKEPAR